MAHGFLTPQDVSGESPIFGKIAKWLEDQWNKERETTKKNKEEVSGKLDTLQKAVEVNVRDVTKRQAPAYKMLRGSQPKALPSGTKALPPGGPRLPGSPDGPRKGGAITNLSGDGSGISADTFFNRAQSGVGASGEYLTNAQRREAFIKSRQETVKTAAATNAPAISPDSGADIVAAVAKNTEAISTLVKVTKEQTSNDTKLSERSALTQEKLMGRQRAAAEERSLEEGKDMSGFLTPTMKKIEQQAKGGSGGGMGGYDANMNRMGRAMEMLDIGSDIMDMRKGKVRRITQGRDGRTSRQRLRDIKARRPGGGVKPRGKLGALSRLGGAAKGAKAGGGLLKGAAMAGKATRGIPGLGLLTAGLEFGDRMSSGQNAFQAGAGTAGSVGGGLAGAAAGAAIGSVVPILGTAAGALIGGLLGSMAGGGTADMLTGANKIPSGAGGMLSSGPMGGYLSMLHGTELTLSGNNAKETKNIGEALGEGMIMASLGPLNPKVLELSAKGMKHYYENMGGKNMFENIFEGLGDIFTTGLKGLGGVISGLVGGAASAATLGSGAGASYITDNTVEGNKRAILASIKAAGYDDRAASNMLAQIEGESGFKMQSEQSYENTSVANIRRAMGDRVNHLTDAQIETLKKDPQQFFNEVYSSSTMNESERMGNAVGEGYKYRGRGFIQLTGKNNYRKIGNLIGVDLVNNPDLMNDPAVAAKASVAYFQSVGANNQNMSTMTGAYNAVYRGNANTTRLDKKDQERVTTRSQRANQFLSQIQGGQLTAQTQMIGGTQVPSGNTAVLEGQGTFIQGNTGNSRGDHFHIGPETELWGKPQGKIEARRAAFQVAKGLIAKKESFTFTNAGISINPATPPDDATLMKYVEQEQAAHAARSGGGSFGGLDIAGRPGLPMPVGVSDVRDRGDGFGISGTIAGTRAFVGHGRAGSTATPGTATTMAAAPTPGATPATPGATPTAPAEVAATPAAANNGTGVMQASAQTSGAVFQQPVTVINNYNVAGQGGGGDVIPNTLGAGVSMGQMGLDSFSQLKIRSLG